MSNRYEIKEKVWGELCTSSGPVTFELEPGETTPKTQADEEILKHLVTTGHAERVTRPKTAKKKEA